MERCRPARRGDQHIPHVRQARQDPAGRQPHLPGLPGRRRAHRWPPAGCSTKEQLDAVEHATVGDLLELLSNIDPKRLISYNRVRKVLDLYLVILVAATEELAAHRQRLAPLLCLPLDTQALPRV